MKIIFALIVVFFVAFAGCNRKVMCSNQYITPAFIGFNASDLDTIIVRQYTKGDNFLHLIDTAIIVRDTALLKTSRSADTTFVLLNNISGEAKYLLPDHDWQIFIPAKNLATSITNIESPQTEETCFKCGCWNPINSLTQNSLTITPQYRSILAWGSTFVVTYIKL